MEGRGPYRIYDPGGSVPPGEASAAFERLVEENSRLKEKMQGIKMLGKACSLPVSSLPQAVMPATLCPAGENAAGLCLCPHHPSVPPGHPSAPQVPLHAPG